MEKPLPVPPAPRFKEFKVIPDPSGLLNDLALKHMPQPISQSEQEPVKEVSPEKPKVVDLGKGAAVFAKSANHLTFEQLRQKINKLREFRIPVFPCDEGRGIAGHIDSLEKYEQVKKEFEMVALGVVPDSAPLLAHFDFEKGIFTQGNLATAAGARALSKNLDPGVAYQLAQEETESTVSGDKDTLLNKIPLDHLELKPFGDKVPERAYQPINLESVKTTHHDKVYAVRVDRNYSTKKLEEEFKGATPKGQERLNQESIEFFNYFKDQIQNSNVFVGGQGFDSMFVYITNIYAIRSVEAALSKAIQKFNLAVKTVGEKRENVDLVKIGENVEYSSEPVPSKDLSRGEKTVKDAQEKVPEEQMFKIGGHIFFRHSKVSEELGIPLPEAQEAA